MLLSAEWRFPNSPGPPQGTWHRVRWFIWPAEMPRAECKGDSSRLAAGESEHAGEEGSAGVPAARGCWSWKRTQHNWQMRNPKAKEGGPRQVRGKGNLSISVLKVLRRGQAFRRRQQTGPSITRNPPSLRSHESLAFRKPIFVHS